MATLILGGIGFAVGGPVGMQIGLVVGGYVDGQIALSKVDVGRLQDRRFTGSTYGASIPRVWGDVRLGGNVFWVAEDTDGNHLIDHTKRTGGSSCIPGSGAKSHYYTATYAVGVCVGAIFCPDPSAPLGGTFVSRNPALMQVWVNDVLSFDSTAAKNKVTPVWHSGSEVQSPDSTVVAKMGLSSGDTWAAPGVGYCLFVDHNLTDSGQQIPTGLSFRVKTDPCDVADVFTDLCRSVGVLSSQIDASAGVGVNVPGFIAGNRGSVQNDVNALLMAFNFDVTEVDGVLKLVARGGASVMTVDAKDLGATTGGETAKMVRTRADTFDLPGKVEVGFFDTGNALLQSTQSVCRAAADVQNIVSIALPVGMAPDDARQIAGRELDRLVIESEGIGFSLPLKYLKLAAGDPVTVPVNGVNGRYKITRAGLAPIGEMRFMAVADDINVNTQPTDSGGSSGGAVSVDPVDTDWVAWSGAEIQNSDQESAGFYVAACGDAGWSGCNVYYSLDSGATWIEGPSIMGRSVFGTATSALGFSGAVADVFDNTNTVGVDVNPSSGALGSVADTSIMAGNNHAILGGEILGVGSVSLTGTGLYTLSHLRRGERSTPMTGHSSGEMFVLLGYDIARVNVAVDYVGTTVQVKCVSRYQALTDVATYSSVVIQPRNLTTQETILASVVRPIFIAPVLVDQQAAADDFRSWTTFDASAYVPETAAAIILQWRMAEDDSTTGARAIEIRPNSGGSTYTLAWSDITRSDADFAISGTAMMPLDAGVSYRKFDYRVTGPTIDTWRIDLIGYVG